MPSTCRSLKESSRKSIHVHQSDYNKNNRVKQTGEFKKINPFYTL